MHSGHGPCVHIIIITNMKHPNHTYHSSKRVAVLALALMATVLQLSAQDITTRYDVNHDGEVNITDVMYIVNYIIGQPVDDEPALTLSATEVAMTLAQTDTVKISGGSSRYLSSSSDASVAYPVVKDSLLVIYPVALGGTDITVRDAKGVRDYIVRVTVTGEAPESVELLDLGLPSGLKWASCNVGATETEGYGGYYAWGEISEKETYDWASYSLCDGSMGTVRDIGADISGTVYDAAHMNWGGTWRMPTYDEVHELVQNCTWKWTTVNGVAGREGTGPNGTTIFFPAAGYRANDTTYSIGSYGSYWMATHGAVYSSGGITFGIGNAYYLSVSKTKSYIDSYYQNEGYSIRAVSE